MATITITSALSATERQRIRRAIAYRNDRLNAGEYPAEYRSVAGQPQITVLAPESEDYGFSVIDDGEAVIDHRGERREARLYARDLMMSAGRTFDYEVAG